MKLAAIVVLLASFSYSSSNVYICSSEGSKSYHLDAKCRGLNACKHEIVKLTKEEAIDKELKLCGWEDEK